MANSYGAAGSFVVLLVWVYYSAQILFLGAEFTEVYTRIRHIPVVPADDCDIVVKDDEGAPTALQDQAGEQQ